MFESDREALDFLIGRIAEEAKREGVPLSEIERKMLYFSETDWTLPEMATISAEFEQGYDQNQFERKIAGLIRKIEADGHSGNQEEREDWNNAVEKLSAGDHYIQVMLDSSFTPLGPTVRPPHDRLKLWLAAFAIVFGFFGLMALLNRLFGPKFGQFVDGLFRFDGWELRVFIVLLAASWAFRSNLKGFFKTLFRRWQGR